MTNSSLEFVHKVLEENNITDITNSNVLSSSFPSKINQKILNYLFSRILVSHNSKNSKITDEELKSFGLPFEKFFISCLYDLQDCNENEWIWYYDLYYGNCFRFNTGYDTNGNQIPLKKPTNQAN